uniref:Uncharacterized protein n=1 Tax=Oryza rufipogon TaxID=4529 RepID=A0A0E0R7T0_ORYRU
MTSPGASSFAAALVVEDFPWVKREEEMGMDPDKYREVFDLAQRGARAFRDGHFDEAISFYSKAQTLRPGDPIILSNRSSAFCMISQVLRERSAADSEYQPLNGLDPTTHAELALKDAEKVLAIGSNSPRPYLLKAYALILSPLHVGTHSVALVYINQWIMVRRIMEGNHRMGMVGIDSATGTVADCGCEVEILEYRVAEIEWLQDISLPDGSQERKDLMERANAASELARTYIRRAREISRPARRARQTDLESMPGPQDPENFSFWLVNLINLRPSDRLDLLRLSDTREVCSKRNVLFLPKRSCYNYVLLLLLQRISRSLRLLGDAEQSCRVQ